MQIHNSILILSSPEAILEAAYHVERWPELLPHYRWVKILRQDGPQRTVQMAARRGIIPIKWTALQWKDEREQKVFFRHLRGPAKGMEVVWEMEGLAGPGGETRVTIHHELQYPIPLLGPLLAHAVIGPLFISPTASRTLRSFKRILEGTA